MRFVRIGRIVAPHGTRGFVRVKCAERQPSKALVEAKDIRLEAPGRTPERRAVEAVQEHKTGALVKLGGVDSRNAAEKIVGMLMSVPEGALSPLREHEFYYYEVVGFRVRTTTGEDLGTIRETFPTGSNDVWVVADGVREHLVPVIADVVRKIDREEGSVTIEPMEGLLEL